jgi:hypothetical protein
MHVLEPSLKHNLIDLNKVNFANKIYIPLISLYRDVITQYVDQQHKYILQLTQELTVKPHELLDVADQNLNDMFDIVFFL